MTTSLLSTKQQISSIWNLGGLTFRQLGQRVLAEIDDNNLLGRASELAYNFLLALFPMVLFLLAIFGLFAGRGVELRNHLLFYLSRMLPPSAFDLLNRTIDEVISGHSGGKITFGILLTLWAAAGAVTSMISALNGAYHVHDSRPWWKVRIRAVIITVGISGLAMAALAVVLIGGPAADFTAVQLHLHTLTLVAWKVVQWPAAVAFMMITFSLVYYYGPDLKEKHWYWVSPGSVFGVLVWLAGSFAFRGYLHFFNTYSNTYGSLGAAIILMVWLYVTAFAFLVGGEINAAIEHGAADHGHPEAKAVGEKVAA
jgi:membrane protein